MTDQALDPPPRSRGETPSPAGAARPAKGRRPAVSRDAAAPERSQPAEGRRGAPARKGAQPKADRTASAPERTKQRKPPAPAERAASADRGPGTTGEKGRTRASQGPAGLGGGRTPGDAVWRALPPRSGPFTGRTRELAELRSEIARPGLRVLGGREKESGRVLLVAGRPGTGRTALAMELARQIAADCPDGQLLVRLVPGEPVPRLPRPLAGLRVVLVVDDVAAADQLAGLLPLPAGCVLVATSDGPLSGVPDVRPCTLGGLDTPAAVALLAHTVGGTRVTNDPRGAETLVQELGGHPAALRLTAAWLAAQPRLSLAEAAARLRGVPAGPAGSAGPAGAGPAGAGPAGPAGSAAPAAPGELVRAFRAVYESLPSTAARILRMLVLAPAGRIDAQSASALAGCSVPAAQSTLDDFVTCALLDRDDPPGPLPGAMGRPYDDRPAPGSPAATGSGTPASGTPGSGTPAPGPAAGPRTAADAPDAPDAADGDPAAPADPGPPPAAAPTAAQTPHAPRTPYAPNPPKPSADDLAYLVPGCLEPLLRALVEQCDRPDDVRLARARMLERNVRLLGACRAAFEGQPPGAPGDGLPRTLRFASQRAAVEWFAPRVPSLLAAARAAVADGELDTLARRLVAALVRAMVAVSGGGPALAAERYELHTLVLGVAERRGLQRERAAALINLADLDAEAGRCDAALAEYRTALDAARAGDDTEAEGRVLEALGGAYLAGRDLPRACDWFGRALALRQGRGELVHQARLHARIGAVLTYQGSYGPALRSWRASAALHRRLGDLAAQARALAEAARVQEYAGHPEDALRSCRDALYWARQAKERRLEAAVLLRLADALDRLGDTSGADLQRTAARKLCRPGELPAF